LRGFCPLVFGEALFDHFPDGSKVLGGAPFNVAWHLQGFKVNPILVTAIGEDVEGRQILQEMEAWGMETSGVQVFPDRPTGRVTARFEDDEPQFDIAPDQAYDAIEETSLPELEVLSRCHLLYHGSLALRAPTSSSSLGVLSNVMDAPRLVDVNLRSPWWDRERTRESLKGAQWVKLNRGEAVLLSGELPGEETDLDTIAGSLREALGIGTLVVTLGADGAVAYTNRGISRRPAPPVAKIVDSVGAGDAFSAVLALGIHRAWPPPTILERATDFAAEICRVRGAITEDRDLYREHLRRWSHAD
jgi:fructokinase